MAASSAMQSILSSPLTRVTNRSSVNQFLVPTCFVSHLSRNATMPVRCMAGQNEQKGQQPTPPRAPKVSTKFSDVFAQIANGGIPWFLATSILLSSASLVPLFKGISAESKSDGVMTSDAEMWNGRFTMLGSVALAVTEYVKGGTLI
uniref:Early light-induced protein n=1 Tax=Fagus sylvatica TaxID=28930 RepID=A0A2N9ETF2_FAGSY